LYCITYKVSQIDEQNSKSQHLQPHIKTHYQEKSSAINYHPPSPPKFGPGYPPAGKLVGLMFGNIVVHPAGGGPVPQGGVPVPHGKAVHPLGRFIPAGQDHPPFPMLGAVVMVGLGATTAGATTDGTTEAIGALIDGLGGTTTTGGGIEDGNGALIDTLDGWTTGGGGGMDDGSGALIDTLEGWTTGGGGGGI
jgi:hypothetical protein